MLAAVALRKWPNVYVGQKWSCGQPPGRIPVASRCHPSPVDSAEFPTVPTRRLPGLAEFQLGRWLWTMAKCPSWKISPKGGKLWHSRSWREPCRSIGSLASLGKFNPYSLRIARVIWLVSKVFTLDILGSYFEWCQLATNLGERVEIETTNQRLWWRWFKLPTICFNKWPSSVELFWNWKVTRRNNSQPEMTTTDSYMPDLLWCCKRINSAHTAHEWFRESLVEGPR